MTTSVALHQVLNAAVTGEVVGAPDSRYDVARQVWNARVDRRPAAIVYCNDQRDVSAAVRVAVSEGVPLAVRGGGHSVAGHGVCDDGIVLDLEHLTAVDVDAKRRVASVGGGARWRHVDAATHALGLATVGGQISSTGVGGLTLGGGVGWLMRRYGLTVDNLLRAEVVLADGSAVVTDNTNEPDLFWAIRGGGGNFGVCTRFEFQLHPVREVTAGVLIYPADKVRTMLRVLRESALQEPHDLTTMVLILAGSRQPFIPDELKGKPIATFGVCHLGSPEVAERDLAPLRGVGTPAVDTVQTMPYPDLQRLFDNGSLPGFRNYWRSPFLPGLPDGAIDVIADFAERMTSPISQVLITHMEGAVAEVAPSGTPFFFRRAPYYLEILAKWVQPEADEDRHLEWADAFASAIEPYSSHASYINFLGEASAQQVAAAYGENLDRLRAIKRHYDPANVFQVNHNIMPSAG